MSAIPRHGLVLAAGLGTRLRPLTYARAKPAIPVAGVPMIRRIITWLVAAGVSDLVLNLHHLPHTLTSVVGDGSDLSARVRYSWEPVVLGSAGGPAHALPLLDGDPFFVINGDTLTDVDLGRLAAAHDLGGALVTLALVPNREPHRYGGVVLDDDGRVTRFARRGPDAVGSFHFVGVQLARHEAFRQAPRGVPSRSIGGIYDELVASRPGAVRGFICDAAFWDVGTIADYLATSRAFGASSTVAASRGRGSTIAASARVTGSILWDDVTVEDGCVLTDCIVTDGVRVPAGATYARVAIVGVAGSNESVVAPIDGE